MMYKLFIWLSCPVYLKVFMMTLKIDEACLQLKQSKCDHELELKLECPEKRGSNNSHTIKEISLEKPQSKVKLDGSRKVLNSVNLTGFKELKRPNVTYLFKLFQDYKTFHKADTKCRKLNGTLAQFKEKFKWEFAKTHKLFSMFFFACTWIGLERNGSEYSWLDGTSYRDETRWGFYQREKAEVFSENCVCVQPVKTIVLELKGCESLQKYVCELMIEHN